MNNTLSFRFVTVFFLFNVDELIRILFACAWILCSASPDHKPNQSIQSSQTAKIFDEVYSPPKFIQISRGSLLLNVGRRKVENIGRPDIDKCDQKWSHLGSKFPHKSLIMSYVGRKKSEQKKPIFLNGKLKNGLLEADFKTVWQFKNSKLQVFWNFPNTKN